MGKTNVPTFIRIILAAGLLCVTAALPSARGQQGNYLLQPNDLVAVTVFQEDDLATQVRVSNDGSISVPLIGVLKVGGRSVEDAAQMIRSRLEKGYLVNAQVNVGVIEYAKRLVTVIGQVQKGGTFEFPDQGPLNLLQAIGLAGGYSKIADPRKIVVKRRVNGREQVMKVDGKALAANAAAQPFEVLPGDTITVGESIF